MIPLAKRIGDLAESLLDDLIPTDSQLRRDILQYIRCNGKDPPLKLRFHRDERWMESLRVPTPVVVSTEYYHFLSTVLTTMAGMENTESFSGRHYPVILFTDDEFGTNAALTIMRRHLRTCSSPRSIEALFQEVRIHDYDPNTFTNFRHQPAATRPFGHRFHLTVDQKAVFCMLAPCCIPT